MSEAEPRPLPRTRMVVGAVAWIVAVPLLMLELVRLFGWDVHSSWLLALSTAWPIIALAGVLPVLCALYVRRIALGGVALFMVLLALGAWLPTWSGAVGAGPKSGLALRLLALNVEYSQATGAAASRQIKANNPDVVVLSELSAKNQRNLDLRQFPYSWQRPQGTAFGQGIYSRWPLTDQTTWSVGGVAMGLVTVQTPKGPVRLFQVHTMAPRDSGGRRIWSAQLKRLTSLMNAERLPIIAAGDFNASAWDGPYSDVLGGSRHIQDASAGRGYLATWPSGHKWLPPVLPLDHVLISRGIGVRHFQVLGPIGSDHRAVIVDLNVT